MDTLLHFMFAGHKDTLVTGFSGFQDILLWGFTQGLLYNKDDAPGGALDFTFQIYWIHWIFNTLVSYDFTDI